MNMNPIVCLEQTRSALADKSTPNITREKVRKRLPRYEREKLIVAEAIRFFAEVGFDGQTRALADRLGVTQPLLYRYFPDKEALIERVYREVFLSGWNSDWNRALVDRSKSLEERVVEFYQNYIKANFSYERIRLFMFAGLKDDSIAKRYMVHVRENLLVPLCHELRAAIGAPSDAAVTPAEIELVAGLHGAVGYVGLRRWVYHTQTSDGLNTVVGHLVRAYIVGITQAFRRMAETGYRQ